MRRYLAQAAAREIAGARALFLLAVAGVALGVASVLSIQLLNGSALGAFSGTLEAISGEADLSVLGWAGSLDESLVPEVLGTTGVASAVPMWRAEVALAGGKGGLDVVGADLLAPWPSPLRPRDGSIASALGRRGWVAVGAALAAEMGWKVGDRIEVSLGSRRAALEVGALLDPRHASPLASRRLAVMDIAQAQGLLGTRDRIHQVDVRAARGIAVADLAARLAARLGDRARVVPPESRTEEAAGLLGAFRLNLTALSLVSLLVGGFLVYASVRASLARRREEIGILRAVGATRGQVLALVLGEAALLGLVGTAAGIPLGWLAARANVAAVSGTLRNVYLVEGIERVAVGPGLLLMAAATGIVGAVAGAALPALDASRRDPRALLASITLEERARGGAARSLAAGLAALAGGALFHTAMGGRWAPSGFVLALGVLAAAPLAAPAALRLLSRERLPRRLGVGYGVSTLGKGPSGGAVAAGALAVAVAMLAGVTVMVGSFRSSVVAWLDRTLPADLYVTTPSWRRARSEATLEPEVVARLRSAEGLVAIGFLRQVQARSGGTRITVSGIDAALPGTERGVELVAGDARAAMRALRERGAALVSEPLARRGGLGPGSLLVVQGREGRVSFPVAGVYRDYGAEAGAAYVDLSAFERAYGPGAPSNAALYLAPGTDAERAASLLSASLAGHAVVVRSNRTLRAEVLGIFEQTFAVTRLIQAMGLVIAAAGVALSLLVLARERRAELALYRALGASRGQLFALFLGRGLAIALAGMAVGALAGAGLALVLVEVVNPAFFGWTLELAVPWPTVSAQAGLILAAALAASLYPALAASRTPAAELSRDAI